jgi:hypothetical protein
MTPTPQNIDPNQVVNNSTNLSLLKLYVDTIPTYDGNVNTLEVFINSCDYLFTTFGTLANDVNAYLLRVVISKLTGRALILIGTKTDLNTWDLLKNALRLSFGDQRNLDCLEQDLLTLFPFKNEPPLEFGKRIQIVRSKLESKLGSVSVTEMCINTKRVYSNQYNKLALKTFIRGLQPQLQNIIRLRNPDTLEQAMAYVTEEENFRYTQNFASFLHHQRPPTSFSTKTHQKQTTIPSNIHTSYPTSFSPHATNNESYLNSRQFHRQPAQFTQPQFPRQTINITPSRNPPQQKFFTNNQVFGKPKNVFRPTGQQPTGKPEPMSTTSRNPTVKHSYPYNPNNNYFRPNNGPKNFVSEELHNIENDQAQQSPHPFEFDGDDFQGDYQDNSNLNNYPEHTIYEENINTEDQQIPAPPYHYEQQIHDEQNFPNASPFYQTTCEINNVSTCNSLPYIKIQNPPLKLLIDTGCFVSIIRPSVAETYFPSSIYHENSKIKTATGEKELKYKADIPAFSEFCSDDNFKFLLYDFHDFFDGIIGLRDLLKLKLSIDLTHNRLISDSLIIPLFFRQTHEKSFTFSVNAHEVMKIKLPVNCKKGKQNTNADALSRIEIHALEKDDDRFSTIGNEGDISETIDKYLTNPDPKPTLDCPSLKELTSKLKSKQKINIISDIQIKPPDYDDNETIHTSIENPVLEIPITNKPVNYFKSQIIIHCNKDALKPNIKITKAFDKTKITASIPLTNFETNTVNILKTNLDPKQTHCLFFKNPEIEPRFIKTVQMYFKNTAFKFIKSNIILQDLVNLEDQKEKLKYHHESKTCHKGINEMTNSLQRNYYWPNMIKDITAYVNNCEICQTAKYERNPPVIKFNLTPTSSKPFEHIHMDTFKILNHSFLTILDSFSRYGQAYCITSLNPINILNSLLTFISHHGLPQKITTDCGGEFKNNVLSDFCKLHKIELHYTTPKNSNSNSPVERFHSTLAEEIRCLKLEKPRDSIETLISYAIIGYNNAIHSVTNYTPFEIVKGHINSDDPFEMTDTKIINNYIQQHKEKVQTLYADIKEKTQTKKEQIVDKLNATREEPKTFIPGHSAYISTKERNKAKPKFISSKILANNDKKLKTRQGTYHKATVKEPRKFSTGSLLQDDR